MGTLPADPSRSSLTAQLIIFLLEKTLSFLLQARHWHLAALETSAPKRVPNWSQKELPKGVILLNSLLEPPVNNQQACKDVERTTICLIIQ